MTTCQITYDNNGTPGIWAENPREAYWGMGWLHGRHRPLQSRIISTAAQGRMAESLWDLDHLLALDTLIHRLNIPEMGRQEAKKLSGEALDWLQAYLLGWQAGASVAKTPFELRVLMAKLPDPTPESLVSSLMLSGYLGLAQSQERMERALVQALVEGAEPKVLEKMFHPHLKGWDADALKQFGAKALAGFGTGGIRAVGGSNAWAVGPDRSHSGQTFLCGDPHLQVNQLPALFFEIRARVGDDYWLGASIAGLPGIAVGRNRDVAWSGTFGVADNVDYFIEDVEDSKVKRRDGLAPVAERKVEIKRRFKEPLVLHFFDSDRGTLETSDMQNGPVLASSWASCARPAEAMNAYLQLPMARSCEQAARTLEHAHTLSLHFVLADRAGDTRYAQAGYIPKRTQGWSGLYPVSAMDGPGWDGFYHGAGLPRMGHEDGFIVSANEARLAADGGVLSTLAQPNYRQERIRQRLSERSDHGFDTMREIQLDTYSLQAKQFLPFLLKSLPSGSLRRALEEWDLHYDVQSKGAHAFEICYQALRVALAPELGGQWYKDMLAQSELCNWWTRGIDFILLEQDSWTGKRGERLHAALQAVALEEPRKWGAVQKVSLPNMVLGGLPSVFGFNRGPYGLPGGRATPRQGQLITMDGAQTAVGPAYRMICDLSEDVIWTALPGGIDGSRFSSTYTRWLQEWVVGSYHKLMPPEEGERTVRLRN